jgi:hypothetical protein
MNSFVSTVLVWIWPKRPGLPRSIDAVRRWSEPLPEAPCEPWSPACGPVAPTLPVAPGAKETKLAPGTILMPGVISHATNIVEHPELIARRLVDWAGIVGRENVVGGADCGMGGRVHSEIGWTKLAALAEGAALATKTLWH